MALLDSIGRQRGRRTAPLAAFLLVVGVLAVVRPAPAAAFPLPVVTMTASPTTVAVDEPVLLTAEVTDPNGAQHELHQVLFCLTSAEFCDFGEPGVIGVARGRTTAPNVGHYEFSTVGVVDEFGDLKEGGLFVPGEYEVRAWYRYTNPDDTTLGEQQPSEPVSFTVVDGVAPSITTEELPSGTVGQAYSFQLQSTGEPAPTWNDDNLPPGLALAAATGLLSGTPTAAGNFNPTVVASNPAGSDFAVLPLTIAPGGTAPAITSAAPPGGTVGAPYTFTFTATGDPAPTWQVTGQPAGLAIDPASGVLAGTPTTAGPSSLVVTAGNGVAPDASASYSVAVAPAPVPPAITSGPPPAGRVGRPYTFTFTASGVPAPTWRVTGQPAGLVMDPVTGVLSGTPTTAGLPTLTVTATNGVLPDAVRSYPLAIASSTGAPVITTASLSPGTAGERYTSTLAATGVRAPTWGATGLPSGLTLDRNSGVISGVPTVSGAYSVVVTAINGIPPTAVATFALTIAPPPTAPVVTFTPAALDFGDQPVATSSAARAVTVRNTGTGDLVVLGVSTELPYALATPPPAGSCERLLGGSKNGPLVLRAGSTCTLAVTFRPTVTGSAPGTLTLRGAGRGGVDPTAWPVPLTGNGTFPGSTSPAVAFQPAALTFGEQPVRTTSPPQTVTVINTGTATLLVTSWAFTGPFGSPATRTQQGTDCRAPSPQRPLDLAPGRRCTVQVVFSPTTTMTGPITGSLTLTGNGGNVIGGTWRLPLTGTTPAPRLTFTPSSVAFGDLRLGTGATRRVVITNAGTVGVELGWSTALPFRLAPQGVGSCQALVPRVGPALLNVGASCSVDVDLRLTALGPVTGSLAVTARGGTGGSNISTNWSVPLSANATA